MSELKVLSQRLVELKKQQLALDILDEFANLAATTDQYYELAEAYSEICADQVAVNLAERALASTNNPEILYKTRTLLAKLYLNLKQNSKALVYINVNKKINPSAELQYLSMLAKEFNE